jgi:glycosyltransferase involved in cell wall biosynthesis
MTNNNYMHILHITAGSDAGGITRYLFDLSTAMQAAGHQITIAGQPGSRHEMFRSTPFPWIEAPIKGGPLALLKASRILRQYLQENPVDLIHTHYRKATLVARRLQKNVNVPILYTLHLSHIPLGLPWRWFTDFGDHTHAAATEARDWLIEEARIPPDRISLIPHGVHTEKFPVPTVAEKQAARAKLGLTEDNLVALYLGRLEDPKNESWLIDLAAAGKDSLPNLRILLAGDGPNEIALRQQIDRQNLQDRVQLLGHREPLPLLQAADAMLLPSQREGFSYACAEAMCAGVPVLRTRTSGTKELIIEGTTGRSIPIDRQAFLTAAIDFLSDKPALQRMGIAAASHIRRDFTFDRQLTETIAMYKRIAKPGSPAPT